MNDGKPIDLAPLRSPRVWLAAFVIWLVIALLFAIEGWLSDLYWRRQADLGGALGYSLAFYGTWALLTPAAATVAQNVRPAPGRRLRVAAMHGLAALVVALLQAGLFSLLFWPVYGQANGLSAPTALWASMIAAHLPSNLLIYAILAGGWIGLSLYREARMREARAAALEARLAQAELGALRAQLQPHFLFNTLNGVSALVSEDPRAAQTMIARLGDLLRMSLESGADAEAPLYREMGFLETYLEIEEARYGARLRVRMEIEPEAADALVPCLLLQPLVENAIRHGIAPRAEGGSLEISGARRKGMLHLIVADDGAGADSALLRGGVGLENTRTRLALLFGARQSFALTTSPGQGFRIEIMLPYRNAAAQRAT